MKEVKTTRPVEIFKCFYCKKYVPVECLTTECPNCKVSRKTTTGRLVVIKIEAIETLTTTTKWLGLKTVKTYDYRSVDPKNQNWVDKQINSKGIIIK